MRADICRKRDFAVRCVELFGQIFVVIVTFQFGCKTMRVYICRKRDFAVRCRTVRVDHCRKRGVRECFGPVLLTRIWLRGLENLLDQDDRGPTEMQILRCAQDDRVVLGEV